MLLSLQPRLCMAVFSSRFCSVLSGHPQPPVLQPLGQPIHFAPPFLALKRYRTAAPIVIRRIPTTAKSAIFRSFLKLSALFSRHTMRAPSHRFLKSVLPGERFAGSVDQSRRDRRHPDDRKKPRPESVPKASLGNKRSDLVNQKRHSISDSQL